MEAAFTLDEQEEIKNVISDMKGLRFFMIGSRQMQDNYDASTKTDWDFIGQSGEDWGGFPFGADPPPSARHLYLTNNFVNPNLIQKQGGYGPDQPIPDKDFRGLLKHKKWGHITCIIRHEAKLYEEMWKRIPYEYWYTNLWKSNPHSYYKDDPYRWKANVRQLFNLLMDKERNRPPVREDFL